MTLSTARLELLHQLAERNEWSAQRDLAAVQRRLVNHQGTEQELRGYLSEYEARPLHAPTPLLLENQRQFLQRLRTAVETQIQHTRAAATALEPARLKWIEQRQALRVAETLLEQGHSRDRHAEKRQSQKEMDEFAITRLAPSAYARQA